MRRINSNTNILSNLINKIISNPKLSQKLDNLKALEFFDEIIGKNIQKYILDTKIFNNKLFIKVKSATVRNELSYQKDKIIKEINSKIGKKIISEIILK
jgi:ABC-type tungstate transport system permease subunit